MIINNRQNGFTLIEVMVTLVIVGALTTIAYNMYDRTSDTWTCQNVISDVQQSARITIDTMNRDLQMIGFDAKYDLGYKDIDEAESSGIVFQYRNDSVSDSNKHRKYSYWLDGTELKKKTVKWTEPIIGGGISESSQTGYSGSGRTRIITRNVTIFTLAYYDGNGNEINAPVTNTDSIRLIKVSITLEGDKGCPQNQSIQLTTFVVPRNIGIETAIN